MHLFRRILTVIVCVTLAAAAGTALAGAQLRLIDGQILDGTGVERRGEMYVLLLEGGDSLSLPFELVAEVKLTGDDDPDATGLVPAKGKTLVGPPEGATLAKKDEQLKAFGRAPSVFRPGVFDPVWTPSSDWIMDPEVNNNWRPVRWATSPIDWNWAPRSAFRASTDVTEFSPVRWAQSPIPFNWYPSDGRSP